MDKLNSKQKRELIDSLAFFYKTDLTYLKKYQFYKTQRGKLYISKIDITSLNLTKFASIGLYFGTYHDENRFRLSIEGSKLITPTRNYIELKKEILSSYLSAENLFKEDLDYLNWEDNCPFLIVKCGNEYLGAVSIKENMVLNYIPKSRKLDYNKLF